MKRILLILAFLAPLYLKAQDIKQHYKIYDAKKKSIVTLDNIIQDMQQVNVLFFGEEHNDSIGHYLEAEIFKSLAKAYPNKVALTMEMFHTDIQPVINEYLQNIISEKNFIKESRAWNNYKDYRPMIELAKQQNLMVIGGNAAARYSNAVTREGLGILEKLPAASKAFLPKLPVDTATGRYYDKFMETLGGHGMGNMKVYQTQNFWDATMAGSINNFYKEHKNFKIFQVNGRFHSDEKLGTYAQLIKLNPKIKALNISSFAAEDFENPDWEKYAQLGDYIIVTDPKIKKTF